ncbi:hypothetical protein MPSEU_000739500 [Mayamaea pseudoterrestris]|nr:hypothetical protein MPSEU_000739500 [Mayamaea pseudoterrestris]
MCEPARSSLEKLNCLDNSASTNRTRTSTTSSEDLSITGSDHSALTRSICYSDGLDLAHDKKNNQIDSTFVGRTKFMKAIQELVRQQTTGPAKAISVIIQGSEASGKTRFLHELSMQEKFCIRVSLVAHDKISHPYSAFWRGLDVFIRSNLRNELSGLSQSVIQLLQPHITLRNGSDDEGDLIHAMSSTMRSIDQTDGAMLQLLRWVLRRVEKQRHEAINKSASAVAPLLVLIIDDLQYATPHARAFIQRVQVAFSDKPLAIIAVCRNVLNYSDALAAWLLHQKQSGTHMKRLPNWSYSNVSLVVQTDPTWKDGVCPDNVAQVVYTRTNGHIGSVLALLRVAREMNYKTALSISSIPVPRLDAIDEASDLAQSPSRRGDDAAVLRHLVKLQFSALPESVQILLQVAAVYLPLFGADSIAFLVRQPVQSVQQQLLYACARGLLTNTHGSIFAFDNTVRDTVMDALATTGKMMDLQWQVGRRLQRFYLVRIKVLPPQSRESSCILNRAMYHLNIGIEARQKCLLKPDNDLSLTSLAKDLAELNTRAADICLKDGDSFAMAEFLRSAIACLGPSSWQTNLSWRRSLETKLAVAELECGHLKHSNESCTEVIRHAKAYGDKKVAVHTRISIMMKRYNLSEAVTFIINELNELGELFPTNFLAVQLKKQMSDIEKRLSRFDWDVWKATPTKTNSKLKDRMDLLERLVECTMLKGCIYHEMAVLRAFQAILDNGPHYSLSSLCFVYWGSLLKDFGKVNEAKRFVTYGLALAKDGRHVLFDGRASVVTSGISLWFSTEGDHSTNSLRQSYLQLQSTDFLPSCIVANYVHSFWSMFFVGSYLADLENNFGELLVLLHDHNYECLIPVVAPFVDLTKCLVENGKVSLTSVKGIKSLDDIVGSTKVTKNILLCRVVSAFMYDDHGVMQGLFDKLLEMMETSPSKEQDDLPPVVFLLGMIALSLATKQTTTSKRYRSKAESMIRKLDGYLKQGYNNCHHYSALLRAQYLAYKSPAVDVSKVLSAFDNAIASAQNRNAIFVRALACERAVHFLLSRRAKSTAIAAIIAFIPTMDELGARWTI